jgi:nitrogen-specific signal transduction histidine kinase
MALLMLDGNGRIEVANRKAREFFQHRSRILI